MTKRSYRRRGVVLVAALVCLLIVMSLLGGMLLGTLQMMRQLPSERDLRQCELLLEAGTDRALERIAREADYRGDTWNLSAAEITGLAEGRVTSEINPPMNDQSRHLTVVAEYRLGGETSIRRSRTIALPTQE